MNKKIGLFGGTFDPVHTGHEELVKSFLLSGKLDELWILLTPFPPHKQHKNQASYSHRLNMLNYAFEDFENIKILTIENELPKPSYTYQSIQFLLTLHPDIQFYYCLGGDSLMNFHTWKNHGIILQYADLLVAEREGTINSNVDNKILKRSIFVDYTPINISSTGIKSLIYRNKSIKGLVHPKVSNYINHENLYSSI